MLHDLFSRTKLAKLGFKTLFEEVARKEKGVGGFQGKVTQNETTLMYLTFESSAVKKTSRVATKNNATFQHIEMKL